VICVPLRVVIQEGAGNQLWMKRSSDFPFVNGDGSHHSVPRGLGNYLSERRIPPSGNPRNRNCVGARSR
jgi:hypothetical protein